MANSKRVRGLTVEINGDVTGLDQALKKTNSALNNTQRELNDVNKLLKLDPKNTELLTQKQKLLSESIENTKDKLKTLKTAQEQALKQLENGEIGQKQYDALQREIAETEQELRKFETAADGVESELKEMATEADNAADKTDELDISLGSMVKNAAVNLAVDAMKAIGDKAIEAAKYVVDVGSKFEAEMDKVAAISGATGGDLAKLTEKAKKMGSTTKFSASESAQAFEYMAMAGWKTNDMLEGIDGIMALAAASGEDLATTSDIVTDALTAFGESAKESGRLADIMAAASSNANTNVSMMGETFKYAAPVAGALGANMEDTAVAIGLMANVGVKASQAGTTLRTGLTNLAKPTKQMQDAMDKYNIALVQNEDGSVNLRETMISLREKMGGLEETEQAAAAAAIFGRNAMAGWLGIINASDEDFDNLTYAIDNSKGAAENMSNVMENNLSGAMTTFKSALEGLGIELYNKAVGPLTGAVEFATGVISGLTNLISGGNGNSLDGIMDGFLEDIRESNKEIETSLSHAESTKKNAEAKVAELQLYGQEFDTILGLCGQFNEVTLDTGEKAITDSSGNIVRVLGEVGTEADTVSGDLKNFASDGLGGETEIATSTGNIVGSISEVEKKADDTQDAFDDWGTDGLKDGEKAIKTSADNIGKDIKSIGTDADGVEKDLKEWSPDGLNTTGVSTSTEAARAMLGYVRKDFDETTGSIKQTYVITDEFTKAKISAMVDTLGGSVDGLSDAWNRQTGELTASKQELDKWFSTAKEVALYTALQDALEEVNKAWGEAAVNVAKAQSGLNHALDEFNKAAGTTVTTYEEWEALPENLKEEYGQLTIEIETAKDTLDESNGVMSDAEQIMNDTAAALEPLKASYENTGKATEEAAEGTDDLNDSLEDTEEAAEEAQAAMEHAAEHAKELAETTRDAAKEIISAFDDYKRSAEDAFSVDPFGKWEQDAEKGMLAFEEAMQSQIDGMLRYRDNLSTVRDNLGDISPEFVQYLEDMGQGGAQLVAEFADAFRNGDTEAVYRLMDEYKQATDIQDDLSEILAADKLAMMAGLAGLSDEDVRNWEDLGAAFDEGLTVIQTKGGELAAGTTEAFWGAVDAAKAVGLKVPEGLADSIRNSEDPALAIQEATEMIEADIQGRAEGLAQIARELGINVPTEISGAIKSGIGVPEACNELIALIQEKDPDFQAAGVEVGEAAGGATAEGITNKEEDVSGAADEVVEAAKDSASTSSEVFNIVGHTAMEALKGGIREKSQEVSGALTALLTIVKNNGTNHGNQIFPGIGSDIDAHIVSGISQNAGTVTGAMNSIMNTMNTDAAAQCNSMRATFNNMIADVSNAINNTHLSFPNIQIPHVRWTWEWLGYADGGGTYYPNFYVDWYAKAMRDGMILDNPTIFGMMNGKFLGAGEAGSETVVGTSSLMNMIKDAVDSSAQAVNIGTINIPIQTMDKVDAKSLARQIEPELAKIIIKRGAKF